MRALLAQAAARASAAGGGGGLSADGKAVASFSPCSERSSAASPTPEQ